MSTCARSDAHALMSTTGLGDSLNRASFSLLWWSMMIDWLEPDQRQTEQETLSFCCRQLLCLKAKKKEEEEGKKRGGTEGKKGSIEKKRGKREEGFAVLGEELVC